jgi:GDP-L-fucose synthase
MNINKILLLGSSGMVGQNILKKKNQYKILCPNRKELNLLNYKKVKLYISKNKPQLVINCAALVGGVKFNLDNQLRMLNENIEISKNVIMASYECDIKNLINLASSCIYPPLKNKEKSSSESFILSGNFEPTNEGYALAKVYSIKLCKYLIDKNKSISYKTIIPCNLYGPYDNFDREKSHLVAAAILKINKAIVEKKKEVEIWGSGNASREFLYVEDLVDFIFLCVKNLKEIPDIINCGYGKNYKVKEYYKIIGKELNYKGKFIFDKKKPEGQLKKLVNIRLQKKMRWYPNTELSEGIKKTIKFFHKSET